MTKKQTINWIEKNTTSEVTYWDFNRVSGEYKAGVKGASGEVVFTATTKENLITSVLDNLDMIH